VKLTAALTLARKELEVRQDIYAYDLLAWTLYKNGHFQEAQAAITEALKLGTQDARLFFHAGMIHARLNTIDQATVYLRQALATNPHFHLFHADVAKQTLRELEERFTQTTQQETGYEP
jgi:Tfp pilus assembly protein PilF